MQLSSFSLAATLLALFYFSEVSSDLVQDFKDDPPMYCAAVNNDKDIANLHKLRDIPALNAQEAAAVKGLQIKQAQVMVRHGARTVARQRMCWKDYDPQWNCQSGEEVSGWVHEHAPSEPHPKDELETFNFPKHFDARPRVNRLPDSNCELGQLVPAGHKQHDLNGKVLYARYFKDSNAKEYLFNLTAELETGKPLDNIYFRSSEYQRTRMSGSQLLTSMVKEAKPDVSDPQIKLHVIEKSVDTIYPNEEWCYDLVDANKEAFKGEQYLSRFWEKNRRARELSEQMFGIVADPQGDGSWPFHPFDCLYTTICMNQKLPNTGLWTRQNLEIMLAASQEEFEHQFRANDARYSKTGFVRFVYDIKAFAIKNICGDKSTSEECVKQFYDDAAEMRDMIDEMRDMIGHLTDEKQIESNKFVLWSAHDNTLGPFLATFGDKFWEGASIPYFKVNGEEFKGLNSPFPSLGSILSLEFYQSDNGPLFRMVYNSRVITEFVPGCEAKKELCSVKTFFASMNWATREFALTPCKMQKPQATAPPSESDPSNAFSLSPIMLTTLVVGSTLASF